MAKTVAYIFKLTIPWPQSVPSASGMCCVRHPLWSPSALVHHSRLHCFCVLKKGIKWALAINHCGRKKKNSFQHSTGFQHSSPVTAVPPLYFPSFLWEEECVIADLSLSSQDLTFAFLVWCFPDICKMQFKYPSIMFELAPPHAFKNRLR